MGPAHGDPIQRTKTQARVGPARCEKSCGTTVWKNKPDGNVIFWWTSALMADPFPCYSCRNSHEKVSHTCDQQRDLLCSVFPVLAVRRLVAEVQPRGDVL